MYYSSNKNLIEYLYGKYYGLVTPIVTSVMGLPLIHNYLVSNPNSLDNPLSNFTEIGLHLGTPFLFGGLVYLYGKTLNTDLIDNVTKFPNKVALERNKKVIEKLHEYSVITCSLQKVKDDRDNKFKYPRRTDLEETTKLLSQEFSENSTLFSNSMINKFYIINTLCDEDDLNLKCQKIREVLLNKKINFIHGLYSRKFDEENFDFILEESKRIHDIHFYLHNQSGDLFETLDFALRQRDQYTSEHSNRVTKYSILLGMQAGLHYNDIMRLELLGALHDIGKIGVSDTILNKNKSLTHDEYEQIKKHPEIGFDIVIKGREDLKSEMFPILYHHERWDGKGYPQGKYGENIPLLSRILAIADTYSAITEDRPYKAARTPEKAFQIIEEQKGKQFDPKLVNDFLEIKDEILKYTLDSKLHISHRNFHKCLS